MASWTWRLVGALACACAGCFSDPGASTASESASDGTAASDASDGTAASASSSSSPSTTSASQPSTSGSPTGGPTSAATDAASSSVETTAGACELTPECQPGQTQLGDSCGGCSVEQRECGDDCVWGEWSCVADADTCGVWILRAGDPEWTALPIELNGVAQYTPDDPIQAAFNLELSDTAYVLTEQEFHVIDLESLTWLNRGDRQDMFAEATEQNLEGAISINIGLAMDGNVSNKEAVILYSDEDYWAFELAVGQANAIFQDEGPCCGQLDTWMSPHAPDPGDMRAIWLDMVGNPAWNPINVFNCPPLIDGTPLTRYAGFIVVDETVRLQDQSGCGNFVGTVPYDQYDPFTLPLAPPSPDVVGAALFHGGDLYVFKADV
ncbi:MAG: hypothetical protein H6713_39495 [Myxococcales bacterium]|nr:hypothetical protein [Myxococcales bacterium]